MNQVSIELKSVNDAIGGEKVKLAKKDHELAVLKEARNKRQKCCKWEQCDELAKHEDKLEVKDMQISLLKAKLLSASNSDVDTSISLTRIHADDHSSWIT